MVAPNSTLVVHHAMVLITWSHLILSGKQFLQLSIFLP